MPRETYQEYPDPKATQADILAAMDVLMKNNPELFQEKPVDEENPKNLSGAMSMPNIYNFLMERSVHGLTEGPEAKREKLKILEKAQKIREGKNEKISGALTLEKLKLPRYKKVRVSVGEFLADPEKYFAKVISDSYFPSVSNSSSGQRYFELGVKKRRVIAFLQENIRSGNIDKNSQMILSEYHKNYFSGNIIINPLGNSDRADGSINVELVEGQHAGLAYGGSTPIIRSSKDFFRRLKFEVLLPDNLSEAVRSHELLANINSRYASLADFEVACESELASEQDRNLLLCYKRLIEKIVEVVNLIPKVENSSFNASVDGKAFYPGYYEFILGNPEVSKIAQLFIDMKIALCGSSFAKEFSNNGLTEQLLDWIKSMQAFFLDYRKADHYSDLQDGISAFENLEEPVA